MYTLNYKNYSIQLMLNLCIKKKKKWKERIMLFLCVPEFTHQKNFKKSILYQM